MIKRNRAVATGVILALGLTAAACGDDTEVEDTADSVADDAEDTADSVADDAEDTADSMADDAEDTADSMADDAEETADSAAPSGDMPDGSDFVVGLTYDLLGRGDQSFNDSAAVGIDQAKADFGVTVNEVTPTDASARGTDLQLQAENSDLVIGVGFSFAEDAPTVAEQNPDVLFAVVDNPMMNTDVDPAEPLAENAAGLVFAEEQGSYLVGVAAALKSETGKIGFIGGVSGIGLIEKFEAGYIAGAQSVNPDIEVVSNYITELPDFDGFEDPARANSIANAMYSEGADIVYTAAGLSGSGTFEAAKETTEATGSKVWGIGVDSDQYLTVDDEVKEYVLTSMIKRVDTAVYEITLDALEGTFTPGETRYDLSDEGVTYATSGGFVDDIVEELETAKEAIISGEVEVPTAP